MDKKATEKYASEIECVLVGAGLYEYNGVVDLIEGFKAIDNLNLRF